VVQVDGQDGLGEDRDQAHAAAEWIKRNSTLIVLAVGFMLFVFPHISPFEGLNDRLSFMQRFSEWTLHQLEELFRRHGYWVVFIGVLVENSMFLGLLVPGAVILILAGLSAENGSINIWYVFGLALIATIVGDTISYMVGRLGWTKALERTGMGAMIEKVREPMEKNSLWLILSYHLAGYSRVVGPAAAGIFRIPFRKWAPLDYTGGAIWVLGYTMLGYVLGVAGVEFGDTKQIVRLLEWFFLAIFAIVIIVTFARQARARGDGGDRGGPSGGRPQPATIVIPIDEDR
jgi:undecaprenyl-diphosphatase